MGCCNSARGKEQTVNFLNSNLPELDFTNEKIESLRKVLKFTIFEIKFSKNLEKITAFPCNTLVMFNESEKIELGDIWNLNHEFSAPKTLNINISNNCSELTLSTLITIEEETIEFGSTTIGVPEIENYFRGIISLSYRGLKSIFLQVELSFEQNSNEEILNLTFPFVDKRKGQFFPIREYPIDLKKYNTPSFLHQPFLSIDNTSPDLLDKLRSGKIQYEELVELLSSKVGEIIYYTLNHLIFFANQSSFAIRLLTESKEKLHEILKTFRNDSLLIESYLQLVFDCIKSLDLKSSEVSGFLTETYSKLLTTVQCCRKIRVFCMEVLIKCLQLPNIREDSNLETLLNFSKESYLNFPSDETASSLVHLFFQGIQLQSSKARFPLIFTADFFSLFLRILHSYRFNEEVLKTCLKILKVFSGHKTFKQILSQSRTFNHLAKSLKFVSDLSIQKLVLELVKEITTLSLNEVVSKDVFFALLAVLNNSYDSLPVAELAVGLFITLASDFGDLLTNHEALECFGVLMVCMKGETELELKVVRVLKVVKEINQINVIKGNMQVFSCLKAISEDYSIPSTGSNHSKDEIIFELKNLVDELLN